MTDLKKKLLIFSLAVAMVTASTSFAMHRIHGEDVETKPVVKKNEVKPVTAVKALFTNDGRVTGRENNDTANSENITDYSTITDLMIDNQVVHVPANKFAGFANITTLAFKGASTSGDNASKVETIGVNAFKGTGIATVVLPKGLTSIEAGAFSNTKALATVDFTNSTNLKFIKTGAFENSGLTSVDLSPMDNGAADSGAEQSNSTSLTIHTNAFKGNKDLATLKLSTKMKVLESEVFAFTKLTAVEIKEHLNVLDPTAFKGTPLATITVDTKNKSFAVEDNVLYNSKKTRLLLFPEGNTATEFTVKENVTNIDPYAFSSSPTLKKVIMGDALTTIGANAFDGASKLAEVKLKAALTQVGQYAFKGTALTNVALLGSMTEIEANAFAGATKLTKLDLRKATKMTTVKANAFKDTALNAIVIGENTGSLDQIAIGAFDSSATSRKISLLNDANALITGADAASLITKYANLKKSVYGSWTFDVKLPTPNAAVDYTKMKVTGLVPSAVYTIQNVDFTADRDGKVDVVKEWGGKTISIVQKAKDDQTTSDAQQLDIDKIYMVTTLTMNGREQKLEKVGTTVNATAPEKKGHIFKTWEVTGVSVEDLAQKKITFTMPRNDVNLTTKYTKIVVDKPVAVHEEKHDLVVTITSPLDNLAQLAVNGQPLTKGVEYTVSGTEATIITLKASYLDKLTDTTKFAVTFTEGGDQEFKVRVPQSTPEAVANYTEMKLVGLDANEKYKINEEVKTADGEGKIKIEKSWGGKALEIIKVGVEADTDSHPQSLTIEALYTLSVNGNEVQFTTAGTQVSVQAERKNGYKFKEWTAKGVQLGVATEEAITFDMPTKNVELEAMYTPIVTTNPAEMVYNGEKEVSVRFDMNIDEFKGIEYNGRMLVKDEDYVVTSGSTIVTFTKPFLDTLQEGMNGMKAMFTNNEVAFAIQHKAFTPPVVDPTRAVEDKATPSVNKPSANVNVSITGANSPNTGDSTNIWVLMVILIASAGTVLFVRKRKQ